MLRDARCCNFYTARLFPGPGISLYGRACCASQILDGAFMALYQIFSEPYALVLEKQTGMKVEIVHTISTAQTAGSDTRLTAEKQIPQNKDIKPSNLKRNRVLALFLLPIAKHIQNTNNKLGAFCLALVIWIRAVVVKDVPDRRI